MRLCWLFAKSGLHFRLTSGASGTPAPTLKAFRKKLVLDFSLNVESKWAATPDFEGATQKLRARLPDNVHRKLEVWVHFVGKTKKHRRGRARVKSPVANFFPEDSPKTVSTRAV